MRRRILELLVLQQLVDELPARIDVVLALPVGVDRVLALRKQHPALYLHQGGRHHEEFPGYLQIELLHRTKDRDILLRHRLDRDVVDVYLVLADQEKEQVKRALEYLELDAVIGVLKHGNECWKPRLKDATLFFGPDGRLTGPRLNRWDRRFAHAAHRSFSQTRPIDMAAKSKTQKSRAKAGVAAKKSASKKALKYVYSWGAGKADGNGTMKPLLGGKGANLAEMSRIGLPVPAGFTITTEVCTLLLRPQAHLSRGAALQIAEGIAKIERIMGYKFGDSTGFPLLVAVRSGARDSMPGMMDTILNLGLNDQTVLSLSSATKNERFAWDCYRRFIQMYGDVVMGGPKARERGPRAVRDGHP